MIATGFLATMSFLVTFWIIKTHEQIRKLYEFIDEKDINSVMAELDIIEE